MLRGPARRPGVVNRGETACDQPAALGSAASRGSPYERMILFEAAGAHLNGGATVGIHPCAIDEETGKAAISE